MVHGRTMKALGMAACLVAGTSVAMSTAHAADEATPPAVNSGKVSLTAGMDIFGQYWYRGVPQVVQGVNFQPFADIGLRLFESNDGPINSVRANVGLWNNFNNNQKVYAGAVDQTWEEADFYASVTVGFLEKWALTGAYQVYKYPDAAAAAEQQEAQFKLAFDDTEYLGAFAMHPYVMYVVQITDNSDNDNGEYVEIGVAPSVKLVDSQDYPVTLTVPVVAGFSPDGTYANDLGNNESWGYVSASFLCSMPVTCIPADYGSWTVEAGPVLILTNHSLAFSDPGDRADLVIFGKFGFKMTY